MKKLIIILALVVVALLSLPLIFFLRFGGNVEEVSRWWSEKTRESDSWPGSDYKNRVESAAGLRLKEATHIVFEDVNLFWKGQGAKAGAILDEDGKFVKLVVSQGGSGYSPGVTPRMEGTGAEHFELGPVTVVNGAVKTVEVKKAGIWYPSPRAYYVDRSGKEEELPFSGTVETKHFNGQTLEHRQYLNGELHGKCERWTYNGIRLHEKEYLHGLRHGTHMYWHGKPKDPDDYKAIAQSEAKLKKESFISLWVEVQELAKREFKENKEKYPSPKSNKWVISKYESRGGSFRVRLLEHYEDNLPHGLFEGFDIVGNKTFKDEYVKGRRIQHKTFDKIK